MKYTKTKQKKNIRDIPYRLMMSRREFDDLLEESIITGIPIHEIIRIGIRLYFRRGQNDWN